MMKLFSILNNIKFKYEEHHHVRYTKEAIDSAVKLSNRYITDRHLPDKAIDVIDEAGSHVHMGNFEVPKEVLSLEGDIEKVRQEKAAVVKRQDYEEAARLRDKEEIFNPIWKLQNVNGMQKLKI